MMSVVSKSEQRTRIECRGKQPLTLLEKRKLGDRWELAKYRGEVGKT